MHIKDVVEKIARIRIIIRIMIDMIDFPDHHKDNDRYDRSS